jgi:DNA-directed RNA polymerase I, II, and III subunit RPABC1
MSVEKINIKLDEDYLENLKKQVYKARITLQELISDRGFNVEEVFNSNLGFNEIGEMVTLYFNNKSPTLDIQAINKETNKKLYVKFIRLFAEKEIITSYNIILRMMNMNRTTDDIVFIFTQEVSDLSAFQSQMDRIEKMAPNVTAFHIKQLQYNITHHNLVPPHKLVNKEDIPNILAQYKLSSIKQFPVIKRNDPVIRYLGLRSGNVVKIERPSGTGMKHIVYRCVV